MDENMKTKKDNFFKGLTIGLGIALLVALFFLANYQRVYSEGIEQGKKAIVQYQANTGNIVALNASNELTDIPLRYLCDYISQFQYQSKGGQ